MTKLGRHKSCLIHHLAYPSDNFDSLNSMILDSTATVDHSSFDQVTKIALIQGPGCWAATSDLLLAFRQLPIHAEDLYWLDLCLDNQHLSIATLHSVLVLLVHFLRN